MIHSKMLIQSGIKHVIVFMCESLNHKFNQFVQKVINLGTKHVTAFMSESSNNYFERVVQNKQVFRDILLVEQK